MTQNSLKFHIRKFAPKNRKAVAEVISSLLLVAITVVGAVILTSFLDESFISGGLTASSSDSTIKSIKLVKYDSRNGDNLLDFSNLNNTSTAPTDGILCRTSCDSSPNEKPLDGGTDFIIIQIENRSVNPIYLHDIWLDNVTHSWDSTTGDVPFEPTGSIIAGNLPTDGKFSIFPVGATIGDKQNIDNQIQSGQQVNLLLKLDTSNPNIQLSKTIRAQFNIGANHLSEFLIESGGAQ